MVRSVRMERVPGDYETTAGPDVALMAADTVAEGTVAAEDSLSGCSSTTRAGPVLDAVACDQSQVADQSRALIGPSGQPAFLVDSEIPSCDTERQSYSRDVRVAKVVRTFYQSTAALAESFIENLQYGSNTPLNFQMRDRLQRGLNWAHQEAAWFNAVCEDVAPLVSPFATCDSLRSSRDPLDPLLSVAALSSADELNQAVVRSSTPTVASREDVCPVADCLEGTASDNERANFLAVYQPLQSAGESSD
jgi:hypothetical protein